MRENDPQVVWCASCFKLGTAVSKSAGCVRWACRIAGGSACITRGTRSSISRFGIARTRSATAGDIDWEPMEGVEDTQEELERDPSTGQLGVGGPKHVCGRETKPPPPLFRGTQIQGGPFTPPRRFTKSRLRICAGRAEHRAQSQRRACMLCRAFARTCPAARGGRWRSWSCCCPWG